MSQATVPPQYQQPQAPEPKKKGKGRKLLFLLVAIVLIIVIVQVSKGGDSSTSSSSSPSASGDGSSSSTSKTVGLNQAARDGKFEFTVKNVDCSKTTLGTAPVSTKAQGVFCLVSVNVKNIGTEAQTLDSTSQYGYDAQGKKFSTDTQAAIYLPNGGEALFNQLNPGSSVDGTLIYDVPTGTKLSKIELHDSMLSGGVAVNLG